VKANKGSAGIDGMTVGQLSGYLKEQLAYHPGTTCWAGPYIPQPVRPRGNREAGRRGDAESLVSQLRSIDFSNKRLMQVLPAAVETQRSPITAMDFDRDDLRITQ